MGERVAGSAERIITVQVGRLAGRTCLHKTCSFCQTGIPRLALSQGMGQRCRPVVPFAFINDYAQLSGLLVHIGGSRTLWQRVSSSQDSLRVFAVRCLVHMGAVPAP